MADNPPELKKGDVIWANRIVQGKPYNHCGIYEGGGRVIHFAAPAGSEISQENAVIHRTTLEKFQDGCPLKAINFPEESSFSGEETIRRARERLGEKGYDFLTNNCDHFATWCKTGEHRSLQVDAAKDTMIAIGGEGAKIAVAIHDAVESCKIPPLDERAARQASNNLIYKLNINSMLSETVLPSPDSNFTPKLSADPSDGFIDRAAEKLKGWTYAITAALEYQKPKLPPPFNTIDYVQLAPKIANTIDKIAVAIKVFTGKISSIRGQKEWQNADIALLGHTIRQKHQRPMQSVVRTVFGRIGSGVRNFVHNAVNAFVPERIRSAISGGFRTIGSVIFNGARSFIESAGSFIQNGLQRVASWFT